LKELLGPFNGDRRRLIAGHRDDASSERYEVVVPEPFFLSSHRRSRIRHRLRRVQLLFAF